jgi:hypothetical protein
LTKEIFFLLAQVFFLEKRKSVKKALLKKRGFDRARKEKRFRCARKNVYKTFRRSVNGKRELRGHKKEF